MISSLSAEDMCKYAALGSISMRCITLVPFAGINPIRFRGSRINGLSLCAHRFRKTMDFVKQNTSTLGTPTRFARFLNELIKPLHCMTTKHGCQSMLVLPIQRIAMFLNNAK
jgi:hypothetical protein